MTMNLLRGLWPMTVANIKSFVRNREAMFWTLAFPVIFVALFGAIFSGGSTRFTVAWVDQDRSPATAQLRAGFAEVRLLELRDAGEDEALREMTEGDVDAVVVVPTGLGEVLRPGAAPNQPVNLTLYTDPSRSTAAQTLNQVVEQVVGAVNQRLSGVPPALAVETRPLQTQNISAAAYFVPSILAMALMQLGLFASIPLVAQREKLILKRLSATPLSRITLVSSNVLMRLLIAAVQTVLIVGVGALLFGVAIIGNIAVVIGLIALGALTFLAIGYLIASWAKTEESATALTSVVQFPMMFLSGIFFPIAFMPEWLQPVAAFLPLTYLADALRQTMVGGAAYVPLPVGVLVLVGWLVVSSAVTARFFRWQ
jgi:ABC-2 type transport system permease protein